MMPGMRERVNLRLLMRVNTKENIIGKKHEYLFQDVHFLKLMSSIKVKKFGIIWQQCLQLNNIRLL